MKEKVAFSLFLGGGYFYVSLTLELLDAWFHMRERTWAFPMKACSVALSPVFLTTKYHWDAGGGEGRWLGDLVCSGLTWVNHMECRNLTGCAVFLVCLFRLFRVTPDHYQEGLLLVLHTGIMPGGAWGISYGMLEIMQGKCSSC